MCTFYFCFELFNAKLHEPLDLPDLKSVFPLRMASHFWSVWLWCKFQRLEAQHQETWKKQNWVQSNITLKATSSLRRFFPLFGWSILPLCGLRNFNRYTSLNFQLMSMMWCWRFMYYETVDFQNSANENCVYHLGRLSLRSFFKDWLDLMRFKTRRNIT